MRPFPVSVLAMISRRVFLARSSAISVGLAAWPRGVLDAQAQPTTYFGWELLAEGARVARGGGGASLVITSDGESLLVDCKGYGLGTTLRREVEADGNFLVAAVNTHHHSPQTGGNFAFTPDVPVFAQRGAGQHVESSVNGVLQSLQEDGEGGIIARRRALIFEMALTDAGALAAMDDFDTHVAGVDQLSAANFRPTESFADSHTLRVGSLEVQLHHFGRAHTDNDVVVWVPDLRLMHVGDLLYVDAHPEIDAGRGGETRSWQRVLQRVAELAGPEATMIPSEGDLVATTHDIDAQIDYFEQIRGLAQGAVDAGMSRQETVDFIPTTNLGRFANLARPELLAVNLGTVYDELTFGR